MFCTGCGKTIGEQAGYCPHCGKFNAATQGAPGGFAPPAGGFAGAHDKRLMRPRYGRKIAGVCAAVADYLNVDRTLVRFVWLVCLLGGVGLLAYIIGWIVIPEEY